MIDDTLDQDDLDYLSDIYTMVWGEVGNNDQTLQRLYKELPPSIKGLVLEWGIWDTEVRESIYELWCSKRDHEVAKLVGIQQMNAPDGVVFKMEMPKNEQ